MEDQNTKLVKQINDHMNTSTSEADFELLKILLCILESELTDDQKRLLAYILHEGLINEISKEIATRRRVEQNIDKNPSPELRNLRTKVEKTTTEYAKIRAIIGNILYTRFEKGATEDQKISYKHVFERGGRWDADSNTARKVANTLRGFKIKK